jgi:hypothetical protein
MMHYIILEPVISGPLALMAIARMLAKIGKHQFAERLTASTTP